MREGNGSQRQGVGLDNGDGVEHGYGAERNGGTAGGKLWQCGTQRGGDKVMGLSAAAKTHNRVVVDGRVVVLWRRGTPTERSGRRRHADLIVISFLH